MVSWLALAVPVKIATRDSRPVTRDSTQSHDRNPRFAIDAPFHYPRGPRLGAECERGGRAPWRRAIALR